MKKYTCYKQFVSEVRDHLKNTNSKKQFSDEAIIELYNDLEEYEEMTKELQKLSAKMFVEDFTEYKDFQEFYNADEKHKNFANLDELQDYISILILSDSF